MALDHDGELAAATVVLLDHGVARPGPDPEGDRLVWATENPADPTTWKWSSADRLLLRLVQECRRRQIRLVVEVPLASVGQSFWAVREARTRGATSKYVGWFEAVRADDPRAASDDRWEWKREGEGFATGPREHWRTVLRRWSDPNGDGDPSDGVDGFAFSGVERLAPGLVREVRGHVLASNRDALVAGVFGLEDEARTRPVDPTPWLSRDALDVAANHAFGAAARSFFLDRTSAVPTPELETLLSRIRGLTRPETGLALLLPIDGPDGERAASRAVNPDREAGVSGSPRDNPRYDVRPPRPEETKRLRLLATFQFASSGAPLVTYGAETGLWGAAEPDSLRPMLRRELRYDEDAGHPLGTARKAEAVRFDEELLKHYQALGRVRASQPALRRGSTEAVLADETRRVYAFARVLDDERVVAAFNLTEKEQPLEVAFPVEQAKDLLSGRKLRGRDGKLSLVLPALSAALVAADAPKAP
jgi:glycosidase